VSIEMQDVRAAYTKDVPILNGIDARVDEGEIVTIIGPNGSGKSTLLRTLMGFVPHVSGSISVDGDLLTSQPSHRRALDHGLAYVPQLDNVFAPLTIEENLGIGGQHLPRAERRSRIQEMYDRYPRLGERRRLRADSLSGGERQMLALARALMSAPQYLLLDEPSAGLSPLLLSEMFDAIEQISTDHGVSVLLVEQNAAQALSISDRAYVLVVGEVALTGSAGQLLDDPSVQELYLGGAPSTAATTHEEETTP
jgi:branched-chain amino acid transport system ATP-binding protein